MFRRTAAPMPQITNALGQLQDKYLQTPYITHSPYGKSYYVDRGYSSGNMPKMVAEGLGEYYGRGLEAPEVQAQPPGPSPGAGYQWNPYNNIWQESGRRWRPGDRTFWGGQYGKQWNPQAIRGAYKGLSGANQQQFTNYLNQLFRNR